MVAVYATPDRSGPLRVEPVVSINPSFNRLPWVPTGGLDGAWTRSGRVAITIPSELPMSTHEKADARNLRARVTVVNIEPAQEAR